MDRRRRIYIGKAAAILSVIPVLLWAHDTGPDPGHAGVPGESTCAMSGCHQGTALNGGAGSVTINAGGSTYTPGVTQQISVNVIDPKQRRWGFQLTARLANDPTTQAGTFEAPPAITLPTPPTTMLQIVCATEANLANILYPGLPCDGSAPLEYIEHTILGVKITPVGAGYTWTFNWDPPATDVGPITLYAAGNAANGDLDITGDHIYTTNVTLASSGGGTTPPPATTGSGQAISYLTDGGGWSTSIIQLNTDSVPANFTLNFLDGTGNPWMLPLGTGGPQTTLTGTIPVGGSQTIQTAGTAANLSAGCAQLVTSNSISGTAIFADQAQGQPISEAAVPIASAGSMRFLLPFDNSPGYSLSVAVANPSATQSASLSITYRDPSGNQTGTDSKTVPPMGSTSFAIPASAGSTGVAEIDSSVAVAGLGIRNNGTAFTSVEALSSVAAGGKTITDIKDGQGWDTSLVLVNTDTAPANFTIIFRDDSGNALTLPLGPDGNQSQLTGTIAPGGSRTITSQGTSAGLVTGWAELDTTSPIGGTAIFGFQSGGNLSEATAPIIPDTHTNFVFPFDGSAGLGTSVAFANPSSSASANISVTFNNAAGQAVGTAMSYVVPPDGHTFAALPVNAPGVAVVTSSTPVSAVAIRSHSGAFTSLRVFGLGGN
jgi:hypothetical protein